MKKAGLEFKVGIFVLTALAVLGGFVMKAGDFYMRPGYTIRLMFDSVSGIDKSSPVKLAGVTVGEVKEVHVIRNSEGQTQVELRCWINEGVYLEDDAEPRIGTMGLLGEKYIEVLPGTSGNKAIGDGGTLEGRKSSNVDDILNSGQRLMGQMSTVMDNANQALDHIKQVVGDPEFKAHVKGTFVNADRVAVNLVTTSEDLKDAMSSAKIVMTRLRDGEGTVGKLLKEDKIAKDLEAFVADIKAHPWKLLKRN